MRKLLYRYLISISTIDSEDEILGLVIVNGKSNDIEDDIEDIYNRTKRAVFPFAKIVTLTENQEDNSLIHENLMNNVFQTVIF